MDKNIGRPVIPLLIVCFISIFMFTRTPGYENIRTVQFLLIFAAGMCAGVALGLFRASRRNLPKV